MFNQKITGYFFFALVTITLSVILYRYNMNEPPRFIHAWTQADRYAMALRYSEPGSDFFHPRTYCLNTQFPAKQIVENPEGITRADFPLNEYIVSLFMKISAKQPVVFRLYMLLLALTGLFFLYRLSLEFFRSWLPALLVVIFVFCSPVYTYYQNGFLPSVASLSLTIIGVYYYHLFLSSKKNKHYLLTIAFLTIASLCRLPFVLWLLGVLAHRGYYFIKQKEINRNEIFAPTISFVLIILNFLYNNYLGNKYGSMFLTELMPAENWAEFKINLKLIYNNWHLHYFSFWQYMIALVVIGVFLFQFKKNIRSFLQDPITFLALFSLAGAAFYFILMQRQFVAHDYYFLDTFFLPLIFIGIILIKNVPLRIHTYTKVIVSLLCVVLCASDTKNIQAQRNTSGDWDRTEQTYQNLSGADQFLDSLNISDTAAILMIDGYTPNMPFILMKRKGYFVLTTSAEKISEALQCNYNYVILQNRYIESDITPNYPELFLFMDKIVDNGKISVYKPNGKKPTTISIQPLTPQLIREYILTFDTLAISAWENTINTDQQVFFSGKKSGMITSDIEYAATIKINDSIFSNKKMEVRTELMLYAKQKPENRTQLVISANVSGKDVFYQSVEIALPLTKTNTWEKIANTFTIPLLEPGTEIKIYLWNQDKKNELFYDDLKFSIFELK